jgi:hypothetical protein
MTLCDDCARATRDLWPIYVLSRLCCLARHIADTPGRTGRSTRMRPVTRKRAQWERLEQARGRLTADEYGALFGRFKTLVGRHDDDRGTRAGGGDARAGARRCPP